MEQSHINKAYDLLRQKKQIEEILYYLTEPEDNVLQEIKLVIKTKGGMEKIIANVPIRIRNLVKNTIVKDYKQIIKNIDEEITSL